MFYISYTFADVEDLTNCQLEEQKHHPVHTVIDSPIFNRFQRRTCNVNDTLCDIRHCVFDNTLDQMTKLC